MFKGLKEFRIMFLIFAFLLVASENCMASTSSEEAYTQYKMSLLYSIEYQHQKPQIICDTYNESKSHCDRLTTAMLWPYHNWQDRVKNTYYDFRDRYKTASNKGRNTLVSYYMGTYNISYSLFLFKFDETKTINGLTFLEFNGADLLALQVSYIMNVWGNFLQYSAYLLSNSKIGILDAVYFM